ncbi:hypothetical protein CkaCkLH20_11641 [Colletotrichum karsti]|uniref:Alcohol dehydrogenase-like C-terminal domain-containing protein n=1 Tax=Colletotrichum karsti TaxID=1095194 RepID=A0A9P6HV76_9PEZI|nr:uncharacterized protein CkaCkLH20_11641 [Colletotrichum karsti]KAF9870969.1 hypothetical protein CkaCkLH20_11641 [Colletotrichum karsti]
MSTTNTVSNMKFDAIVFDLDRTLFDNEHTGRQAMSAVTKEFPVLLQQHNLDHLIMMELHVYRGHQKSKTGFIMGHEFTGTVTAIGKTVKSNGGTCRCSEGLLFGSALLDGGQAEFVRIPLADGTIVKAPPSIPEQALVVMADIFPTGYFGVKSAVELLPSRNLQDSVVVVIGCGPVGLCAITVAAHYKPKHLFAVDSVDSRLDQARRLGAEPLNFLSDKAGMQARVREVSDGRGADVAIEVVGLSPALRTAFDLIRPLGVISSIGIPWTGNEAYNKNVRLQMGRCPVRSIFPEALALLEEKHHLLGFMFENILPLSEAVKGYELFDNAEVQKVIFKP